MMEYLAVTISRSAPPVSPTPCSNHTATVRSTVNSRNAMSSENTVR